MKTFGHGKVATEEKLRCLHTGENKRTVNYQCSNCNTNWLVVQKQNKINEKMLAFIIFKLKFGALKVE